jgi:hypothetical protein
MINIASSGLQQWLLVIAFALTPATSSAGDVLAQTAEPRRLTLSEAVELARLRHPLIVAAKQRVAIAEGRSRLQAIKDRVVARNGRIVF